MPSDPDLVDVVLPAGGSISGPFAQVAGTDIKCLIRFQGRTVLEHTIAQLRQVECIGRIVVIGREQRLADEARRADAVLPEGSSAPDNIYRGMDWLRENRKSGAPTRFVLVLTGDLPFVDTSAIRDLIGRCTSDGDVFVPGLTRAEVEGGFPGVPGIWTRLADGEWTLGCGFMVRPEALLAARANLERVFAARKSQFRMAALLGFGFVIRFLMRRLTVDDIARRCSELLGCRGVVVRGASPALAVDLDDLPDFTYATHQIPPDWGQ